MSWYYAISRNNLRDLATMAKEDEMISIEDQCNMLEELFVEMLYWCLVICVTPTAFGKHMSP